MADKPPIAVLGAGSWGTALAVLLAHNGNAVRLWSWEKHHVEAMAKDRCNQEFLAGIDFPDNISVYHDLAAAVADIDDILIVVPSHAFRTLLQSLKPLLSTSARIAWATKGFDSASGELLSEVTKAELGNSCPLAVLSGPSFALEVATFKPTAVTLAATDENFGAALRDRFHCHTFRIYLSDDLIGVQIGGAVKNVLAIAVGISDGMSFGANTRAALITRGLAEMIRLGVAMGGRQETFMGLAGVGDLVLTCTDDQSRNRRYGLAIGRGVTVDAAKNQIKQVVEGSENVAIVHELAAKYHVDMPISEQVHAIVSGKESASEALNKLLARTPKYEVDHP